MNKLIASLILVASIASAAEQSAPPPGVSVEPPQGHLISMMSDGPVSNQAKKACMSSGVFGW